MLTYIDKDLAVSWCLELEDGTRWFDSSKVERSLWFLIKDTVEKRKDIRIKRMYLFATSNSINETEFNGAMIESMYRPAYFYMNKAIAVLGNPTQHLHALGHLNDDNKVDIRWYDSNMNLIEREYRDPEKCQLTLIHNNLDG